MMRLFIEGRQVDLSENEVLQVTREIADIREPAQRSSDWSRTFRIPGTSANNKLFGHIFDVNQEQLNNGTQFAPDFNPNKKAVALVTVNEVEQLRGFVRLLNISVVRKGQIEYEVSVHGEVADLFAKIRNKKLSELDLSELNHTLSKTAVKNSWAYTAASGGYVYPMIDRGRENKTYDVWGCEDFTPAVFAKVIVDKIFTAAGYSYSDDSFFNTEEFKSRVIPFPKLPQLSEATIATFAAKARRNANQSITTGNTTIVFNDDSSSGYYDTGGNFNTSTGIYTAPNQGVIYEVNTSLDLNLAGITSPTQDNAQINLILFAGKRIVNKFTVGPFSLGPTSTDVNQDISISNLFTFAGDELKIVVDSVTAFNSSGAPTVFTSGFTLTVKPGSFIQVDALQSSYGVGQLVDFNSMFVSGDWQQDKFLSDLLVMDNLYCEPTTRTRELYIAPRDTFYRDSVVHDLTAKIDYSQPLEIIPMGELDGNPYVFSMAVGKDVDSEEYNNATGKSYGEARIIIDNDFIKNERKIETTFASTPYNQAGGKLTIASMPKDGNANGELRILYWSGKITNATWKLADAVATTPTVTPINPEIITGGYPHAGHLNNPWQPTKDLNFGMPYYVNLPNGITYPNNNLFNREWRKYLTEITDRNSKIVKARVYITPADWLKFSFRDLYYFENQYFRLNKIQDYQVGSATVTECEFLKIKTANVFTPQTGKAGGGYDAKDDNNDRWPDLRGGLDVPARQFGWNGETSSNGGLRPVLTDWVSMFTGVTTKDIGTPSEGDQFRPVIEWSGQEWVFKAEAV